MTKPATMISARSRLKALDRAALGKRQRGQTLDERCYVAGMPAALVNGVRIIAGKPQLDRSRRSGRPPNRSHVQRQTCRCP